MSEPEYKPSNYYGDEHNGLRSKVRELMDSRDSLEWNNGTLKARISELEEQIAEAMKGTGLALKLALSRGKCVIELGEQVEELVEAGRAVDEFFVFFDSIIPPDNTGPRITLRKLSAVLAKHAEKKAK